MCDGMLYGIIDGVGKICNGIILTLMLTLKSI